MGRCADTSTASPFSEAGQCASHVAARSRSCAFSGASRHVDSSTASPFRKRKCRANRITAQSRPYVSSSARRRDGAQTARRQAFLEAGMSHKPHRRALKAVRFFKRSTARTARKQFGSKPLFQSRKPRKSCRRVVKTVLLQAQHAERRRRPVLDGAFPRHERIKLRASSAARMSGGAQAGRGEEICVTALRF